MGIHQRREQERQEIRQRILSAAREIATEEGWQAVTTRKVAERIEYSQSTLYKYFENKEAMLLALLRSGYEQLVAVGQAAFASTGGPEARLLAMTEAYWLVEACRGLIHGLVTLTMVSRIAGGPERAKHILQETMKDLLFAWSHRPPG